MAACLASPNGSSAGSKAGDDRVCKLCLKRFPRPWELKRHQARKTPCAPILDQEDLTPEALGDPDLNQKKCRFCGRVFASRPSMLRHVRSACRIAPNERNGALGMDLLYEHTIRRQRAETVALRAQVAALAQNVEQMSGMMRRVLAQTGAARAGETAIVGDHATVLQDRRITINVFGKEAVGHVTSEKIRGVLEESMQLRSSGQDLPQAAALAVMKAALLVYSDPDHPENLTCYLPNKREGNALVHMSRDGRGGWEVCPLRIVAPPMAQKSVDLLFDKQPFEDAEMFEPLLAELRDNEARYAAGNEMRTILVRNKALLARALEALPIAGET
jgi:hypothetical protein